MSSIIAPFAFQMLTDTIDYFIGEKIIAPVTHVQQNSACNNYSPQDSGKYTHASKHYNYMQVASLLPAPTKATVHE